MRKFAVCIAAFAAIVGTPAFAADMAVKAPPPAALPAAPAYSWTGCFIGANGGGLWARKNWEGREGNQLTSYDVDGGLGGLQAGCDYQTRSPFVVGIQGDYDWVSATGSGGNLNTTHFYNTRIDSLASVTGRVGYAVGQFLGYGKGGVAWERDSYSTSVMANGLIDSQSGNTRSGWTLGVGGEYAFTNWLSGFVEYDYYNFGSHADLLNTRTDSPFVFTIKENKNVVKAGLNLRCGGTPAGGNTGYGLPSLRWAHRARLNPASSGLPSSATAASPRGSGRPSNRSAGNCPTARRSADRRLRTAGRSGCGAAARR